MFRRIAASVLIAGLAALLTGCTMCQSPYDYCGPTFTGGCEGSCDFNARAGSILSPPVPYGAAAAMPAAPADETIIEDSSMGNEMPMDYQPAMSEQPSMGEMPNYEPAATMDTTSVEPAAPHPVAMQSISHRSPRTSRQSLWSALAGPR